MIDAGGAVALAVAVTVAISVAREQGRPPDALAYALAPTLAALALVRRRWPLAVLLASSAALFIYNQFDYPGLFRQCLCRSRAHRRAPGSQVDLRGIEPLTSPVRGVRSTN